VKDFLTKLQNQPEPVKKLILWLTVIVIGIICVVFYIWHVQRTIANFNIEELKKQLNLPGFGEQLKNLPQPQMPEISEEELKKLQENATKTQEEK